MSLIYLLEFVLRLIEISEQILYVCVSDECSHINMSLFFHPLFIQFTLKYLYIHTFYVNIYIIRLTYQPI